VDLDPQFNATQYVMDYKSFEEHRKKAGTIAELMIDQPALLPRLKKIKRNPNAAIHNVVTNDGKRFDILPAELNLAWVVKNPAQMEFKLEKALEKIRGAYDYVFIDCAPTDSVLTTMALTAADHILIPMRPDRFSILGYSNLVRTIETFKKNCPDPHAVSVLGIVYTQVTNDSNVEQQAINEIDEAAKQGKTYRFASSLPYSKSFIRSVNDQTPIFATAYTHPKTRYAMSHIASEMTQRIAALSPVAKKAKK
jgi:chromosome partitioning protein